jgi:hypothetical protein
VARLITIQSKRDTRAHLAAVCHFCMEQLATSTGGCYTHLFNFLEKLFLLLSDSNNLLFQTQHALINDSGRIQNNSSEDGSKVIGKSVGFRFTFPTT